jgi:hypothetical protein
LKKFECFSELQFYSLTDQIRRTEENRPFILRKVCSTR